MWQVDSCCGSFSSIPYCNSSFIAGGWFLARSCGSGAGQGDLVLKQTHDHTAWYARNVYNIAVLLALCLRIWASSFSDHELGTGDVPTATPAHYGWSYAGDQPTAKPAHYGWSYAGDQPTAKPAHYGWSYTGDQPTAKSAHHGWSYAGDELTAKSALHGWRYAGHEPTAKPSHHDWRWTNG